MKKQVLVYCSVKVEYQIPMEANNSFISKCLMLLNVNMTRSAAEI